MIFGHPEHEHIQLNEDTVWGGGPHPDPNRPDAYKSLPAIREALHRGDYVTATKLVGQTLTSSASYTASYQTLGDLDLEFKPDSGTVANYSRWLDLSTAVAGVQFTLNDTTYRRESFASHPDRVLVTHLTASQPGHISFTLRLSRIASAKIVSTDAQTLLLRGNTDDPTQQLPGAVTYEAQAHILTRGGTVQAVENTIVVANADEATILLAAGTDYILDPSHAYHGTDPHPRVTQTLAAASQKSYAALLAAHESDFQALFNRVILTLPSTPSAADPTDVRLAHYGNGSTDPSLAILYYQFGRYLLISASRADSPLPSNLQGIWGDGIRMPWNGDFHTNINYPMFYWPSETANLSELHLPALRLDATLVTPGTRTAQAYFNAPGWAISYTTDAWGWTAPGNGMPWGPFFPAGGWLMQDVWEHYAFTQDKAFLARYYPLLKGSAEFYLGILVRGDDGLLSLSPSLSPENSFKTDDGQRGQVSDNAAIGREIVWDLFTNTVAAQKVLHTDPALRRRLEVALAHIRPFEIGRAGQLEEWGHDWDLNGDLHHRHVSHLFGLFPGWQISTTRTPALAAAARTSLELRGDASTGWSNAWKINLWAHLHDGDHALKILGQQLQLVPGDANTTGEFGGSYANLFDVCPPFQIDGNFGSTSGIDEMLLQSSERYTDPASPSNSLYVIDLLPALPSLWASGSIRGLRARGGFQVDETWQHGQLLSATITSLAGTHAQLRYAGRTTPITLHPGASLTFSLQNGLLTAQPH
jgi:alpha-L-fucosidase 2